MGRRPKLAGPRTVMAVWANLGDFCADCPLQAGCFRSSVPEVLACDLVQAQVAEDRGRRRPALLRSLAYEQADRVVREPYHEVDPEEVNVRVVDPLRRRGRGLQLAEAV